MKHTRVYLSNTVRFSVLFWSIRIFNSRVAMGGYHEMLPGMQAGTLSSNRPAWPDGPRRRLRKLWSYLLILEWTCPCWQRTRPGAGSPGPSRSPAVLLRGWPPEHKDSMWHSVRTMAPILFGFIPTEEITWDHWKIKSVVRKTLYLLDMFYTSLPAFYITARLHNRSDINTGHFWTQTEFRSHYFEILSHILRYWVIILRNKVRFWDTKSNVEILSDYFEILSHNSRY